MYSESDIVLSNLLPTYWRRMLWNSYRRRGRGKGREERKRRRERMGKERRREGGIEKLGEDIKSIL